VNGWGYGATGWRGVRRGREVIEARLRIGNGIDGGVRDGGWLDAAG